MRKNSVLPAVAALLGFSIMLQTGCKKGAEPGTAIEPEAEIFNIKYAIKKSGPGVAHEKRIAKLRSAYEAAGELNERWPDDPSIDPFLKKAAGDLNQIPRTVFTLSLEVRDLESFKWAFDQPVKIEADAPTLMKVWKLGTRWRDLVLANDPERVLPLYMEAAVEQRDVEFFNTHIEAFSAGGYKLHPPVERSIFYTKYCRFMAEQFDAAIQGNDSDRIRLLLSYLPQRSAVNYLDTKTTTLLKGLGDHLFYDQKDEALAIAFIKLGYPLNPVQLSRTKFSSGFVKTLTADPAYAVTAFQLNKWHGPLGQQETLLLINLPDELLKTVDQRYLDDTIKLCLAKKKNKLALKLIQTRFPSGAITDADYDLMLNWALQTGNNEFFKYVMSKKGMDIQQIPLTQLAQNEQMFMKYAPNILASIAKNEKEDSYDGPTTAESIRDIVTSPNHAAALYLIKKYDLAEKWDRRPSDPTLLMEVCQAGNLPAAKYLINTKRQDPLEKTPYTRSQTTLFGSAKAQEGNLNLIHLAAQSGNSELINYLASKKISVNDQTYFGVTPLMYAASNGHLEAAETLLTLGANVNASMNRSMKDEPMPEKGSYSQLSTAYRRAQAGGHREMLALLKKAGARP